MQCVWLMSGYGGLSLSIEGPSKADIECQDNEDGSCRVTYRPTEPGNYVVNVKFADEHVPGNIIIISSDNIVLQVISSPAISRWYYCC